MQKVNEITNFQRRRRRELASSGKLVYEASAKFSGLRLTERQRVLEPTSERLTIYACHTCELLHGCCACHRV